MRWSIALTDEFVGVWIPVGVWISLVIDEFVGSLWVSGFQWVSGFPWSIAPTDGSVGV
jgi:hypothetical protein